MTRGGTRRPVVLVVEDDLDVARVFASFLQDAGLESVVVTCGGDAVDYVRARVPAAVVVDVGLPDVNGIELVAQLRQLPGTAATAIVLATADGEITSRVRGMGAGADDYLAKPVNGFELVARVKAHLTRHEQVLDEGARARELDLIRAGRVGAAGDGAPHASRRAVEEVVDLALLLEAFAPVFQPIVETAGGRTVGYEALTRFTDGTAPDQRFAEAAGVGRGFELEIATMGAAIRDAVSLPRGSWLSVNVSPALLLASGELAPVLRRANRPVVLELSEHDRIDDYEALQESLRRLGPEVQIAVDDTGEGYASLRHVLVLHPTIAKLDRAWISGIDGDPARQAMVAGLQRFAGETGCSLVAEGVERAEELDVLAHLGVPLCQGYLTGRPAPATAFTAVGAEES